MRASVVSIMQLLTLGGAANHRQLFPKCTPFLSLGSNRTQSPEILEQNRKVLKQNCKVLLQNFEVMEQNCTILEQNAKF